MRCQLGGTGNSFGEHKSVLPYALPAKTGHASKGTWCLKIGFFVPKAFKRELKVVACIAPPRRRRRLGFHLPSTPKLGWDPPLSGNTHCPNPYHAASVLPPLSLLPRTYHACMTQHSFARHSVCHTYLCSATDVASTASGPQVTATQPNITAIQYPLLLAHGDCRQKAEPIVMRSLSL